MLRSITTHLKALKPFQLALVMLAAVAVLGAGTATAKSLITGKDIANHSIKHADLHDDAVTSMKILDGHVYRRDLAPGVQQALDQRAANGVDGKNGIDGKDGANGENGATGPAGPKGDPGVKGDKGDPGVKGDKGDPGVKGDKGDPGVKGDKGDPGVKGDKGDPGVKGDKGDKGDPGPSASATIDAATTSLPALSPEIVVGETSITTAAGRLNINGAVTVVPEGTTVVTCEVVVDGDDSEGYGMAATAPGGQVDQVVISTDATVTAGSHQVDVRCASSPATASLLGGRVNIIATG